MKSRESVVTLASTEASGVVEMLYVMCVIPRWGPPRSGSQAVLAAHHTCRSAAGPASTWPPPDAGPCPSPEGDCPSHKLTLCSHGALQR